MVVEMKEWTPSQEAFKRGISSGYILGARQVVFKMYCDMFDAVKPIDGITSNELQDWAIKTKHSGLGWFEDHKVNHINKHTSPLRKQMLLDHLYKRKCKVKRTSAYADILSNKIAIKLPAIPSKDKQIKTANAIIFQINDQGFLCEEVFEGIQHYTDTYKGE